MGYLVQIQILCFILAAICITCWANPPLQSEKGDGRPWYRPRFEEQVDLERMSVVGPKYKRNDTFIPEHYEVKLLVILDDDPEIGERYTAPGSVSIVATPSEDTQSITLHALFLRIDYDSIRVSQVSDPAVQIGVTGHSNDTDSGRHFLKIDVDQMLTAGTKYNIYLEFVAPVSTDRTNGLYLSKDIREATGEQRLQAGTQMESYHARQLFPSFDEPGLKANFDVEITRKDNYTSLANTNLISSTPDPARPGWTTDKFATTAGPMPTYLFAMVVSDFPSVESTGGANPVPVRVFGPSEMIERGGGNYTVALTAELLTLFDEYFGTVYPFPKLDSVALPVKGGAMENWGLILYRWDLLMYFPGLSTERERYSITDVVAHEVAHQNFGNLVTCQWWSLLWLNEGFATYIEHLGVDWTYPEFLPRERMLNDIVQTSMIFDAGPASHPLFNDALTPPEIDSIFSDITYEKGGSIIRMIENFLTEQTLQKGLRYYLEEKKFQPVEQSDLYRNLQKAVNEDESKLPAGVTIKDILDTWTLQKGFPLVKVTVASPTSVVISQERFRNESTMESWQLDPNDLWFVPLTVVTEEKPVLETKVPELWLEKKELAISYTHNTSTWIMLNQDGTGYYRTMYDATLTSLIIKQLEANASVISPLSRSQLLDDYFTFGYSGRLPIGSALDLTRYLLQEDHHTVWQTLFTQLRRPYNLFGGSTEAYLSLKNYLLPLIEAALIKATETPNPIGMAAIHRERLFDWACSLQLPSCVEYARLLFNEWQETPSSNPIPVDLRVPVQCAVVASQGKAAADFVFERYRVEPIGPLSQRPKLLNALACATDPDVLKEVLESTVNSTSGLADADRLALIDRVSLSPDGRPAVLQFLNTTLSEVISVVGNGSVTPLVKVFRTLGDSYSSQAELIALESLMEANLDLLTPIAPDLNSVIGTILGNIRWMTTMGHEILQWLSNQS